MRLNVPLKYRIAVTIVILTAAAMALVLWQTLLHFREASRSQLAATEQVIVSLLRDISRPALLTGEYAELQPYFERVQRNPHVLQILLTDMQREVLLSTNPVMLGKPLPPLSNAPKRAWRLVEISNAAGPLGMLAVEFTHAPLGHSIEEARNAGLQVGLLVLAVIAGAGLVMGLLLTKRLQRLTRAAQHIAEGKWDTTSGLEGRDEVARVGQAFDAMARELATDRAGLEAARQQLEIRLQEHQAAAEALERRVSQMRAVAEVGQAVSSSLDPQRVLNLIVEHACRLLHTERSALAVLEPQEDTGGFRFVAIRGLSEEFSQRLRPRHWRDGSTAMAIATRRPVWSADLLNDPAFALSPETAATVQTEGYRAVLSVPLVIGTRVLGALVVYRDMVGPFTLAEIELLEIFAAQAVIALENARLFNESSQQRARLSSILELNKRIASRDDMPSLLSSIAEESARLVGADGGSVRILQDDQLVAIGKTHDDSAIDSVPSVSLWEGAAGRCVREQCVLIIEDIQSHPEVLPAYQHRAAALGLHALVNIPIRGSRGVIGVLTVTSKRSRTFSADEITALSTCAEQAAIAIENAQLLDDIRQQTTNLSQMNTILQSEVAERQRTETALRESETRYRTLVDGSIQGVFIHHQFTIQFANPAMASIFGYDSPGDLIGRDARMLIAPHEVPRVEVYNRQRLQGEAVPFRYEWQGVRQDGQLLWIESVASVVSWAGRPSVLTTFFDITERKRLETQLLQAQKMEAIGTLAGGIAHDFNNILSAIIGYTELAAMDTPSHSAVASYQHEVLVAARRARDLVQQILAFSRQHTPERQAVQLAPLVRETLILLRASLPSTLSIVTHLDGEVGAVLADPTQIHQVLMNLCTNAEYAMRDTGGTLEVGLERLMLDATVAAAQSGLQPGSYVRLRVSDTGHGIPPEVMARIFDPFFTTKAVGEGSGMGLAVVHGIVTNHHGAITVSSAPGQGTTFDIYLPSAAAADTPPTTQEAQIPSGHERILFVDDEPTLARMGQQMLSHLGYTVTVCSKSPEALDIFRADPYGFDLVITDQTMPHMTGEVLARELRAIRPDIPIILCTGFSHTMTAEKAQALHLQAYLFKPLVTRDLAVAIREALVFSQASSECRSSQETECLSG